MQWKLRTIQEPQIYTKKNSPENLHFKEKIELKDDSLINELNFCFAPTEIDCEVKEDNSVLIRGSNSSAVNSLLAKMNFEFEEQTWKRPPATALVLDHIYGV